MHLVGCIIKDKSIHFCVWCKNKELRNSSLPLKGKQLLLSPLVSFVVREGSLSFYEGAFFPFFSKLPHASHYILRILCTNSLSSVNCLHFGFCSSVGAFREKRLFSTRINSAPTTYYVFCVQIPSVLLTVYISVFAHL